MAGLPISYIREKLEADNPIARIMPNTNAHVGHSVTGISFQVILVQILKMKSMN